MQQNSQKLKIIVLAFLLLITPNFIFAQETQKVDIQSGYLEIRPDFPDAAIWTREANTQVYIVHEGIEMWCDQAYVYMKDNFVKAFGNVRISQGDTLTLNSKYGEYNGNTQFAFASGNVILKEPNTTLTTDTLYFDRIKQQAFYRSGGKVIDTASILTSRIGRYYAETKKYQFLSNVVLNNPEYVINTNQLDFFTETGNAYLYGPSTIVSETSTVYCERGFYDTREDYGYFMKNARIDYDNRSVYGDSLYFNRKSSFASATNNIKVLDTLNNSLIKGHYAEVYREKDSVFITKRAVAITLRDKDSIYIHADTLRITGKPDNRILKGFYGARIYKSDMSGKSDSIYVSEKMGITKMINRPVMWSGESQMTGDTIHILTNKKTEKLDSLKVFKNAFLIQKDSSGYNQVKGEILIGLFTNNELDTININRNTEVIFFTRNDKDELVGINHSQSSSIQITLEAQEIQTIRFLRTVDGKLHPESQFPENARILRGFEWRGEERLLSKQDLFKGKPIPILPKITGIPLPDLEEEFFKEIPAKDLIIPEASQLLPKNLQNDPKDFKPLSKKKEVDEKSEKKDNESDQKIE
ncbi:MAG: OstA-like protein [Bacteroidetes bacterium HGW-Bacteroidetes-2]|jgi:lipopolysaccharide export system protein LptA|nr:MAG: OstA-like protein [Bacteroidetes bacterium HGW-Bacteroidetes-2]